MPRHRYVVSSIFTLLASTMATPAAGQAFDAKVNGNPTSFNNQFGREIDIDGSFMITGATMLADSKAEPHCLIKDSIIGWHSTVGSWCHISDVSVLGEKVEGSFLHQDIIIMIHFCIKLIYLCYKDKKDIIHPSIITFLHQFYPLLNAFGIFEDRR